MLSPFHRRQALMMLRMSTKQKINENFTRLNLDEMKASAIDEVRQRQT
jgi:hypothetical protein